MSAPTPSPAAAPDPEEQKRQARVRLGIVMMCCVSLIFAIQDTMSRALGGAYSPVLIVTLRYWFFAAFSLAIISRQPGGVRGALRTTRPGLQVARGLLLAAEIVLTIKAFVALGIVNAHSIFAIYPLLTVAMSGPLLGERIGWRRWTAVAVGFVGILVILRPGSAAMSPAMLIALVAAFLFALYNILTRKAAQFDSGTTSFLWTSLVGAAAMTPFGLAQWEWLSPDHWGLLALLCLCAAVSHGLLIRAYGLAEASVLQPFAYTQLAWVALFGILFFNEHLAPNVVLGIVIVVGAGLFSLWRSRVRAR